MSDDSRISPYNLSDCKNTTDDALQNYLSGLKIKQSYLYTDIKLALGYSAVLISAVTFAWDYKLGFEKTKYYTAAAVVIYFALNGAFTYWIWAVEKDVIFTGDYKGQKVVISSKTRKHDPTYLLTARYSSPSSTKDMKEVKIQAPFTQWFTADGYFVAKPFQEWLASSVPLIGQVDPKNAAEDASQGATKEETVAASGVSAVIDELASSSKKGAASKKRRG